jgi:hypothetical protein
MIAVDPGGRGIASSCGSEASRARIGSSFISGQP